VKGFIKMLKIGFCINSLEMGGAERLLVDIVNALYETKNYEIHILTKLKSNSYFFNLIKDKIKYDFLLEKKSEGFFSKTRDSILKKINFKKFSDKVDIIIDFLDGDFSEIDTMFVGPTPPDRDHNYTLKVFALSEKTGLKNGFWVNELLNKVKDLTLGTVELDLIGKC